MYHDRSNWPDYEAALRQLAGVQPRRANIALGLIGANAHNLHRWTELTEANKIRRDLLLFEEAAQKQIDETNLPDEQADPEHPRLPQYRRRVGKPGEK